MKSTEALFYNKEKFHIAFKMVNPQNDPNPNSISLVTAENWLKNVGWEDFISFCRALAPRMKDVASSMEYVMVYDSDANMLISKMYQNEIGYSSIVNGKGQVDFENATEKAKLKTLVNEFKTLKDEKVLTTKGCENKYGSDFFTKYKCIFTIGSTGGSGYNDPGSVFEPGVCKIPASNNKPLYVSQGPTLTFLKSGKKSNEQNDHLMDLAWQFAKYLTSPAVNTYMCIYGSEGYMPVSYSAYDTTQFSDCLADDVLSSKTYNVLINDIQDSYLITPVFPGSAKLRTEAEGIVKNVLTGAKNVDTAIQNAIDNTKMFIK